MKHKEPCEIIEVEVDTRFGKRPRYVCKISEPDYKTNIFVHFIPKNALRCPDGPPPTDEQILSVFRYGEEMTLYQVVDRIYPPRSGSTSVKGAHKGVAFRAKSLYSRLKELESRGLVKFIRDGGDNLRSSVWQKIRSNISI